MRCNASRARLAELLSGSDPTKWAQADTLLENTTPEIRGLLDAAEAEVNRAKRHEEVWMRRGLCFFIGGLSPMFTCFTTANWEHLGGFFIAASLGGTGTWLCLRKTFFFDKTVLRHTALRLAEQNAPFAMDYLLEAWQTQNKRLRAIPDEETEERLLMLFSRLVPGEPLSPRVQTPEVLQARVRSCFPIKNVFIMMFCPNRRIIASRGELSNTRADLLVTLLRHLAASPDAKDREVVEWVAQSRALTPNQTLVRDAAQMFLQAGESMTQGGVVPSANIAAVVPAATPTSAVRVGQGTKP